ncbi:MAG: glutamate-5-semialdehyde dehydrogenase, partial [Kineosporiaceae bacterium]
MSITDAVRTGPPGQQPAPGEVREAVHAVCRRARQAARELATAPGAAKTAALLAVADALEAATDRVVRANEVDLDGGRRKGLAEGLLDRLRL